MAMIKRWIHHFITWLYVRYVFLPELFEKIEEEGLNVGLKFNASSLNPAWDDIEDALREKDHNTLQ